MIRVRDTETEHTEGKAEASGTSVDTVFLYVWLFAFLFNLSQKISSLAYIKKLKSVPINYCHHF